MTEFIYNGEKYTTFNLKKELRKMGITQADITLVEAPKPVVETVSHYHLVWWDPISNHTFWIYPDENNDIPKNGGNEFVEYLKNKGNIIWDEKTKTGCGKYFTEEYAKQLVLLKSDPIFPITMGEDGTPITK